MELKQLKGIGEKTEKTLNRAGIEKVEDLLDYYPGIITIPMRSLFFTL